MLIEFEVANYLSFKDPVRLSMVASTTDKEMLDTNTFQVGRYRLLKCAAIYGANASGKSNLLKALNFMAKFVETSAKESTANDPINVVPFKFDYDTESAPSRFEVIFLIGEVRFRYGFEVTQKQVVSEWLFYCEKVKEEPLFLRAVGKIDVYDGFSDGKGLEARTRDNALFLSVVALFNGVLAIGISDWFEMLILMDGQFNLDTSHTAKQLMNDEKRNAIISFLKNADIGIEEILVQEKDTSLAGLVNSKLHGNNLSIRSLHKKYQNGVQNGFAALDLRSEESQGTQKLFSLVAFILKSIELRLRICFDELDIKFHPLLTKSVVHLFNSSANSANTQLIFTTHDTNLLQFGDLRRDQIWFTEKDEAGATDLYSLAEFKVKGRGKVRKDAAYEKNYIQGRYGAIPFLGDFGSFLKTGAVDE